MGLATLATVVFGTFAARRGAGGGETSGLLESASAVGRSTGRLGGGALVTVEIALRARPRRPREPDVRSFTHLRAVDLGFSAESVVTARVSLEAIAPRMPIGSGRSSTPSRAAPARTRVGAASVVNVRPFRDGRAGHVGRRCGARPARLGCRAADRGHPLRRSVALSHALDPARLGERLRRAGAARRAAPRRREQAMVRTLWPSESPLGRRLAIKLFDGITAEVIGVVGDVRLRDARTTARPTAYLAASRCSEHDRDVVVRGDGGDEALAGRGPEGGRRSRSLAARLRRRTAREPGEGLSLSGSVHHVPPHRPSRACRCSSRGGRHLRRPSRPT